MLRELRDLDLKDCNWIADGWSEETFEWIPSKFFVYLLLINNKR